MANYTAAELSQLKKLMAKRTVEVKASAVFALAQKLKVPCKLQPRIRDDMTNAEKNDAFDKALQSYVKCLVRSV